MKKTIRINLVIVTLFITALVASYYIAKYWPSIVRN